MPESGTTPAPRDRIAAVISESVGGWNRDTAAITNVADAILRAFPVLAAEPTTAIPSDDDLLDVLFDADPNARLEVTTAGIRAVFDAGVRLAALAPEPAGVATHNTVNREQIAILNELKRKIESAIITIGPDAEKNSGIHFSAEEVKELRARFGVLVTSSTVDHAEPDSELSITGNDKPWLVPTSKENEK